jgi:diacylglycerol O-acyltransferase
MTDQLARLGPVDLVDLAIEDADTPTNIGAMVMLDGRGLIDAGLLADDGPLKLTEIRTTLAARTAGLGRLRQVIVRPGLFGGRPLWTDDAAFRIEHHVREVRVPPPADEPALLRLTADLLSRRLDRSRPLWRVWFATGLPTGDVAMIVAMHHVLADGTSALRLLASLMDGPVPPPPRRAVPRPRPRPHWSVLVRDNIRQRASAVPQWRPGRLAATVRHLRPPVRPAGRTSLNAPIGPARTLAVLRLPLGRVRQVAHVHEATINDVVLALATGGLRALLIGRGEHVTRRVLNASIAVSLRSVDGPAEPGNVIGTIMARLPLFESDPHRRLRSVNRDTAAAKRTQLPTVANLLLLWLARLGLLRWASRHQHITNVVESDLIGPREPLHFLGATATDIIAVGNLAGNIGISFVALSYRDTLAITVHVDAVRFPDLPVVIAAMRDDWGELASWDGPKVPAPESGRP